MTQELADLVEKAEPPIETILIDAESIHDVDTTGVQSLEELVEDLERGDITLAVARLRNAVRRVLDAADLIERIGEQNVHLEVDDGVKAFLNRASSA